jgi:hypothetical protein
MDDVEIIAIGRPRPERLADGYLLDGIHFSTQELLDIKMRRAAEIEESLRERSLRRLEHAPSDEDGQP